MVDSSQMQNVSFTFCNHIQYYLWNIIIQYALCRIHVVLLEPPFQQEINHQTFPISNWRCVDISTNPTTNIFFNIDHWYIMRSNIVETLYLLKLIQTLRIIWQYMGAMSGIWVCIWFLICSKLNFEHVWRVTYLSF